jgi:hypothetical protein
VTRTEESRPWTISAKEKSLVHAMYDFDLALSGRVWQILNETNSNQVK